MRRHWIILLSNGSSVTLTLLDVGLLGLVGQELVQFLLIGITELGEVELRRGVHFGRINGV